MNEKFSTKNENSFDSRFEEFVKKTQKRFDVLDNEERKEEAQLELETEIFIKNLPRVLSGEGKLFLENVSEKDFDTIISHLLDRFTGNRSLWFVENMPVFSKENLQNILLYRNVFGYGNPDLIQREIQNPIPTAQEVLMGCYIEQIEKQTREAVKILRTKGYKTVQSGFYDHLSGSQFFDICEQDIVVPETLVVTMQEKFNVAVQIYPNRDSIYIEIIPSKYYSAEEWETILTFFAEQMPVIDEETFAPLGGLVDFAVEIIEKYPIEVILASAKSDHERELIQKLYACKTDKEIAILTGNADYIRNNEEVLKPAK